ncbi:hypothetical protein Sjap_020311 [Stephania japonica]|uniref:Uncharacterized protein n=1 Tax=Stephania japonica TaxID=461633 RepID=A0AAP0F381_9MAGN
MEKQGCDENVRQRWRSEAASNGGAQTTEREKESERDFEMKERGHEEEKRKSPKVSHGGKEMEKTFNIYRVRKTAKLIEVSLSDKLESLWASKEPGYYEDGHFGVTYHLSILHGESFYSMFSFGFLNDMMFILFDETANLLTELLAYSN